MKNADGIVGSIRQSIEQVYLIGFKFDPAEVGTPLYSVVLYNETARSDQNRPLTAAGRIVLFTDPNQMEAALRLGDAAFQKSKATNEVTHVHDVHRALELIQHGQTDPDATILNLLNELFDFVQASKFKLKPETKALLGRFADHLTFNRDFGAFLDESTSIRGQVLDALLWILGAVLASSTLLPSGKRNKGH